MKKCARPSLKATLLALSGLGLVLAALIAGGLATRDKRAKFQDRIMFSGSVTAAQFYAIPGAIAKAEAAISKSLGMPVTVLSAADATVTTRRALRAVDARSLADLNVLLINYLFEVPVPYTYTANRIFQVYELPPTELPPGLPSIAPQNVLPAFAGTFGPSVIGTYVPFTYTSGLETTGNLGTIIVVPSASPAPPPPPMMEDLRISLALQLVKDVSAGAASSDPASLFTLSYHDRIYFTATTPESGRELWITDGTAEGTKQLADLAPGGASSNPRSFTHCWDILYFVANDDKLYATRNGAPGSVVDMGVSGVDLLSPGTYGCHNGRFIVGLESQGETGAEPWFIPPWPQPGAAPAARRLADINPGQFGSNPALFVSCGPRVYFTADDGVHGYELWSWSGGFEDEPEFFFDANPGPANSGIGMSLACVGGTTLYFGATDLARSTATDGTVVTNLFRFNPALDDATPTRLPLDGSTTVPSSFVALGSDVFFVGTVGGRSELYVIVNGVTGSGQASLFKQLGSDDVPGNPRGLVVYGTKMYFIANHNGLGERPFVSDGTVGGTVPLAAGVTSLEKFLQHPAGVIFYGVDVGTKDPHIYFSSGTPASTYAAESAAGIIYGSEMALLGARLLVPASTTATGKEPYIGFAAVSIPGGTGGNTGPLVPVQLKQ